MVTKNTDNPNSPRISNVTWLLPVLNNQNTPPTTPKDGDRYRVTSVATGAWTGKEDYIAIWDADSLKWVFEHLEEAQIWYDFTSQNWHYFAHGHVLTQFDKIPLAESDVTGLVADLAALTPLTTFNAHKSRHVAGAADAFVAGDLLDATAKVNVIKNTGAIVGTRRAINLIEGSSISMSVVDNALNESVDITINSAAGGAHALLDGVIDNDTLAGAPTRGAVIVGNATPKWSVLSLGGSATYLRSNGTDLVFSGLQSADIVAALGYTPENPANKGVANGYAGLDGSGIVPTSELPALNIIEVAEASNTPVADNQEQLANARIYTFITLPTTEKYYRITGIEWKNGSGVAGYVACGVDLVDANPPVNSGTSSVAKGAIVPQSGISSIQRNSNISSQLIKGGTLIGVWVQLSDSVTAKIRSLSGQPSVNVQKGVTTDFSTGSIIDNTAWSAQTYRLYTKVYYVGIK